MGNKRCASVLRWQLLYTVIGAAVFFLYLLIVCTACGSKPKALTTPLVSDLKHCFSARYRDTANNKHEARGCFDTAKQCEEARKRAQRFASLADIYEVGTCDDDAPEK